MAPPTKPALTDQNLADIRWLLEQEGCPQLPEGCDPESHGIYGTREDADGKIHNVALSNPAAVLNTVVVWVMEVADWFATGYWKFERLGSLEHPVYAWVFEDEKELITHEGEHIGPRTLATLAMLSAICTALRETDGGVG